MEVAGDLQSSGGADYAKIIPTPLTGTSTAEQSWRILFLGLLSRVFKVPQSEGITLLVHVVLAHSSQAAGTAEYSGSLRSRPAKMSRCSVSEYRPCPSHPGSEEVVPERQNTGFFCSPGDSSYTTGRCCTPVRSVSDGRTRHAHLLKSGRVWSIQFVRRGEGG